MLSLNKILSHYLAFKSGNWTITIMMMKRIAAISWQQCTCRSHKKHFTCYLSQSLQLPDKGVTMTLIFSAGGMWTLRLPGDEQIAWSRTACQCRGGTKAQQWLAPEPADHCSHMLEIEFHHHVGLTAWQGLGESYKSLTWKQNMSLWLFESGQVFDPLPNVAQVPAGSGYEYDQGS